MNYPVASIVAVNTVSAVVLIVTIVAKMGIALADFASAKFVLKNSAEVGVSTKWLPILGALKAAGAVGLLLGLLGVRPSGIAAGGPLWRRWQTALCMWPPLVRPPKPFDPAQSQQKFILETSDYVEFTDLPLLVRVCARDAPGITPHHSRCEPGYWT